MSFDGTAGAATPEFVVRPHTAPTRGEAGAPVSTEYITRTVTCYANGSSQSIMQDEQGAVISVTVTPPAPPASDAPLAPGVIAIA